MMNCEKIADMRKIKLAALFVILFIVGTLLISSLFFVFGGKISPITAILSAGVSAGGFFLITKKEEKRDRLIAIGIGFCVIAAAVLISSFCFDFTYDGNCYHKTAVGCLRSGWNPLKMTVKEFMNASELDLQWIDGSSIWTEHYCKASWIFGANIYAVTGNIESGKCINALLAFVLFILAYSYLKEKKFTRIKAIIISVLLTLNPVTFSQLFTFYVDGLLFTAIFGIIISLIWLTDKDAKKDTLYLLSMLASFIIICINIKFTGLAYAAFFCFSFYVLWLILAYREKRFKEVIIKSSLFYVAVVAIAVLWVGSSSYVTNFIDHGHPFYPLFGEGCVDIMTGNQPKIFADMSGLEKLFYSLFSNTENIMGTDSPTLVPPFFFRFGEFAVMTGTIDTRISGFGPFFGEILVISLVVIGIALFNLFKKDRGTLSILIALLAPAILLIFIIEETWWARYSPYLYLIPILALALIFKWQIPEKGGKKKIAKHISCALVCAALSLSTLLSGVYMFICTYKTARTVSSLLDTAKISDEVGELDLAISNKNFHGIQFNLIDFGIDYELYVDTSPSGDRVYEELITINPQHSKEE